MAKDLPDLDKIPLPRNIDAEQMLLGALLKENDWFAKVSQHVAASDFYDPVHTQVFEMMAEMIESGRAVSPVSIKPYVDDIKVGEIRGFDYVMRLFEAAPKGSSAFANALECAKIVKDMSIHRAIYIVFEEEMADILAGRPVSALKRLDRVEVLINDMRPPLASEKGFERFDKAAARAVDIAARAYQRGGVLAGLSTGLKHLDDALGGLHRSDLLILAGATGAGKSALAINITYSVARGLLERQKEGEKTGVAAFFSLEMPSDQIAQRILAEHSRVSGWKLRKGFVSEGEFASFEDSASALRSLPIEIDASGGLTITQVMMRARQLHKRRGIELLVVDYLQLLKGASSKKDAARYQEISDITAGLKMLAKELDVPIIALAQVGRDVSRRDDKRPMLADLREGASIEMDADVVLFVYREEYYLNKSEPKEGTEAHNDWSLAMDRARGAADIIIAKNRHGPEATIRVGFDATLTRFHDDAPDAPAASSPAPKGKREKGPAALPVDVAIGLKRLKSMEITKGTTNDGVCGDAPKGVRLVRYYEWKKVVAEDVLDPNRTDEDATKAVEKITKALLAADLIGRAGARLDPWVWLNPAKK